MNLAIAMPRQYDGRILVKAIAMTIVAMMAISFAPTAQQIEQSPVGVVVPDSVSSFVFAGEADAWPSIGDVWDATKNAVSTGYSWGGYGAGIGTLAGCAIGLWAAGPAGCGVAGGAGAVFGFVGGFTAGANYGFYSTIYRRW